MYGPGHWQLWIKWFKFMCELCRLNDGWHEISFSFSQFSHHWEITLWNLRHFQNSLMILALGVLCTWSYSWDYSGNVVDFTMIYFNDHWIRKLRMKFHVILQYHSIDTIHTWTWIIWSITVSVQVHTCFSPLRPFATLHGPYSMFGSMGRALA